MEFVSAEEFSKQSIEIQIIFMEWWIPKAGDLFFTNEYGLELYLDKKQKGMFGIDGFYTSKKVIPILTEGQLRKFIEDSTDKTMDLIIKEWKYTTPVIEISLTDRKLDISFKVYGNLLEAYWKVALKIAKEKVKQ